MLGGFKVLINGKVIHCKHFEVDYDEGIFKVIPSEVESMNFNRKTFAIMTVTKDDMEHNATTDYPADPPFRQRQY